MQLGNNYPFGSVNHKSAGLGHQRDFTHVNVLLLDVLDDLVIQAGILVIDNQTHFHSKG